MSVIDEVKSYFMAFGCTENQAESKVKDLLDHNEIEEFYRNMYLQ